MNAPSLELSISVIAAFSADGRVFRSFGHLLGSRPGELLLVPLGHTTGDLRNVVDCCPVPWEEVWAVLDTPVAQPELMPPEEVCQRFPRLAQVSPYGWTVDRIPPGPETDASIYPWSFSVKVLRLTHPSGIRFAYV